MLGKNSSVAYMAGGSWIHVLFDAILHDPREGGAGDLECKVS
ncbi:MAG: hypothetical protein ACTSUE_17225 [Promethearchaeota archaeon]